VPAINPAGKFRMSRENATGELPYTALYGLRALAPIIILTNHWSEGLFTHLLSQQQLSIDIFFAVEVSLSLTLFSSRPCDDLLVDDVEALRQDLPALYCRPGASFCLALLLLNAGISEWTPIIVREAATHNLFLLPTFADETYIFPLNPPHGNRAGTLRLRGDLSPPTMDWPPALGGNHTDGDADLPRFHILQPRSQHGIRPDDILGWIRALRFWILSRGDAFSHKSKVWRPSSEGRSLFIWAAFIAAMFIPGRLIGLPLLFIGVPALVWLAGVSSERRTLANLANRRAASATRFTFCTILF